MWTGGVLYVRRLVVTRGMVERLWLIAASKSEWDDIRRDAVPREVEMLFDR
jgi:hypothetical protein